MQKVAVCKKAAFSELKKLQSWLSRKGGCTGNLGNILTTNLHILVEFWDMYQLTHFWDHWIMGTFWILNWKFSFLGCFSCRFRYINWFPLCLIDVWIPFFPNIWKLLPTYFSETERSFRQICIFKKAIHSWSIFICQQNVSFYCLLFSSCKLCFTK